MKFYSLSARLNAPDSNNRTRYLVHYVDMPPKNYCFFVQLKGIGGVYIEIFCFVFLFLGIIFIILDGDVILKMTRKIDRRT
ncbi:hypothetical protein SDC9_178908 [bioreactor metagenome]|uniref:Uncharacterized protein n=1 Tax=bioreactor metagenome TaxID=1076179 RepID=A0A645H526_9ZZZZ